MNSHEWLRYFEHNRTNRPEPAWHIASPLEPETQKILARSLSHFQLGESGEGKYLLKQAREQAPDDRTYAAALAFFIAEETEHARLLEFMLQRFGCDPIRRHWTQALFRVARRTLGLNFEIQVLVIAELVGTAYRMLKLRTRDPVLEQVCALVLRDEKRHIEFHIQRLRDVQSRWLPAEREAWSLQFQLLFTAAANVAWFDHRDALKSTGGSKREFFRSARAECIQFLAQMNASSVSAPPLPSPATWARDFLSTNPC